MNIYPSTKVLPYVYWLTHKETGQFYIGVRYGNKVPSSEDLGIRYFTSSKVIKNFGFENFIYIILAEFFDKDDALLFELELIKEYWSDQLKLNQNIGGVKFSSRNKGIPMSEEQKRKLSISAKNKPPRDPLLCKQIGDKNRGRRHSEEVKERIRNGNLGKILSKEHKEKLKNYVRTDKTKSKISKSKIGKPLSEEHKQRIRDGMKISKERQLLGFQI